MQSIMEPNLLLLEAHILIMIFQGTISSLLLHCISFCLNDDADLNLLSHAQGIAPLLGEVST